MSPRLGLQFLGPPRVVLDGVPVPVDRRPVMALLAYLAVNDLQCTGERHSRESLSGLLWPDYDQTKAFTNLRHTLWEIHQNVGKDWIFADRGSVGIRAGANIDLDVSRFQELIALSRQQSDPALRVPLLAGADKLYRNHLLMNFSLHDSPDFNEWVYLQAEYFRAEMIEALAALAEESCTLGRPDEAIRYGRRLVAFDPLNEDAHRRLMQAYLQAGMNSTALQQYLSFEKTLRKELGLDPQPETRALYNQIRRGEVKSAPVAKQVVPTRPKHNLPVSLTTFIGREKERDNVCGLLAEHRLVTLTGAGGIGKTRLSIQVGEKVLEKYPDGVRFLGLDALTDPDQVPHSLAALFNIQEISSRSVMEQLVNVLGPKTILLILDNCEHLRDASAQLISALLKGCPQLKILATSREILGVEGEIVYTVPSLSLPRDSGAFLSNLSESESLLLFRERAELVLQSFRFSQENAGIVAAICRRLDGIPLAIELAAARVDILQPQEILEQLNASFALLVHRGYPAVPRHQSMRASMDWSWGLLSEAEQVFMCRLSVFVGGWTLEAAQKVCSEDALPLLDALAAKSLIAVKRAEGQVTRYRLHEIIRQYAAEKLQEAKEFEMMRERHLRYFLSLAGEAESGLYHGDQWYLRLNAEHGNLHAALVWAERTDVQAGLNILSWLCHYWRFFALGEANRMMDVLIHKSEAQTYPAELSRALWAHAVLLLRLEQLEASHVAAQAGLDLARVRGDEQTEIDNLVALAALNEPAKTREYGQRALTLALALKDPLREVGARLALANGQNYEQDHAHLEKVLRLSRAHDFTGHIFDSLLGLGLSEFDRGDFDSAKCRFEELLAVAQKMEVFFFRLSIQFSKGMIAIMNGDLDQAQSCMQEVASRLEETGNRVDSLWNHARVGHILVKQGKITEARMKFEHCAQQFFADRRELGLCYTFEGIAALNVIVSRHEIAAQLIGWADAMRRKNSDLRTVVGEADTARLISACILKMGEEAFSDAYDAGQTMTMEEAVKFALEISG